MKAPSRSIHASLALTAVLSGGIATGQVTEEASTELVAAFDDVGDTDSRDTGTFGRSFFHRNGTGATEGAYSQVAVPSGTVNIGGVDRNVTKAFLTGSGEFNGSYDVPSLGDATFEVWVEITDTDPDQILFEAGGSGRGIAMGVSGGQVTFFCLGLNAVFEEISAPITAGWHQVVGVITNSDDATANDSLELFLDGVSVAESVAPVDLGDWAGGNQGGFGRASSSFCLGSTVMTVAGNEGEALPVVGRVAICRLYDRALSPAEILEALATGEGPAPAADTPDPLGPKPLATETRAGITADPFFEFDASLAGTLEAWSNTGTDGRERFDNSPLFNGVPTEVNDGSVAGIRAAYDTSALAFGLEPSGEGNAYDPTSQDSATFEVWVQANVAEDSGPQIIFEAGGTGRGVLLSLNNDQLSFFTNAEENTEVLTTITSGWHQIVGVINNSFNTTADDSLELFVDGASVGTSPVVNINDWAGGNQAGIGNYSGGSHATGSTTLVTGAVDAPFQGLVAAFRHYNRALNPTEIMDNFGQMTTALPPIDVPTQVSFSATEGTVNGDDFELAFTYSGGVGVNVYRSPDLTGFSMVGSAETTSPFIDTDALLANDRAFYSIDLEQTLTVIDFSLGDFASDSTASGTMWERGTPTFGPSLTPSGGAVWGTDLDSEYGTNTNAVLQTDLIDLAGIERAVAQIVHFYDIEFVEGAPESVAGFVRVVDAAGASVLADLGQFSGSSDGWAFSALELPEDVLGGEVRLEFELVSDDLALEGFAGWFLQSVQIEVVPGS